jgi:PLP dependent protein
MTMYKSTPIIKSLTSLQMSVPKTATLVAVTKGVTVGEINQVIKTGVKAIGENRVEDFGEKLPHLLPVEKHFIGQIQSRKIKRIIELFDVIQSVGSIEHLEKIEKEAEAQHKHLKILLQFNISGETQKGGFGASDIENILRAVATIKFVKVTGVMGMASNTQDSDVIRKQFRVLRDIRDRLRAQFPTITELSMGMSNDYRIAIEEGATMLRIGRALFNDRIAK